MPHPVYAPPDWVCILNRDVWTSGKPAPLPDEAGRLPSMNAVCPAPGTRLTLAAYLEDVWLHMSPPF